jgi:hypothetical protein
VARAGRLGGAGWPGGGAGRVTALAGWQCGWRGASAGVTWLLVLGR